MKQSSKENDKYYVHYRYFNSLDEMMEYVKQWPDLPASVEYYEKYFADRLREIKLNVEMNCNFTNKMALLLQRSPWDGVEP